MYDEVIEVGFGPVGMASLQEEMGTQVCTDGARVGQERTTIHKPKKGALEETEPEHPDPGHVASGPRDNKSPLFKPRGLGVC